MRTCPRCNVNFPSGVSSCPNDGTPLVEFDGDRAQPPRIEPTESIVAPDPSDLDLRPPAQRRSSSASSAGSGSRRTDPLPPVVPSNSDVTRAERPIALAHGSSGEFRSHASGKNTPTTSPPRRSRSSTEPGRRIGQVLGKYRLVDVLGQGGMGCVYQAEHIKLGRSVALKLLRADHAERRDAVARFFQEARAVNKIRHRNIVDVTDFVELDDGTTFIIMELLDGISLGKLSRSGNLQIPRAMAILIQICDGLSAAHAVGIIHRDLKPDNVVVVPTRDGADLVKLLDFGVAKLLIREEDEEEFGFETAAGAVVGTPTFMSPEQAGGLDVDERSDIYSLGAIMYEVFCGEPVFRGRSFGEFVRKHLTEVPVRPSLTRGGKNIDDRLEAMIMKCLEKEPGARYQAIEMLREDLTFLLAGIETSIENIRDLPDSGQFRAMAPRPPPVTLPPSEGLLNSEPGVRAGDTLPSSTPEPSAAGYAPTPAPAVQPTPAPWPAETALTVGDLPADHAPAPTGTRSSARLFAGAVVGLGAVAALAVFLVTRPGDEQTSDSTRTKPGPSESAAAAPPSPTVTPMRGVDTLGSTGAEASAPAPGSDQIVVRFTSTPSANVLADGSYQVLCTTPCDLTIVRNDTNSPGKRLYSFRRNGYRSRTVTVDLRNPRRTVHATLQRHRGRSGSSSRAHDKPSPTVEPLPPVEKVETKPTDSPEPARVEPKKDPAPPDDKIDPSVTLDPFGR